MPPLSPARPPGRNGGGSRSNRRRDGCTECRRKKVKCDLKSPVCSRCARYPKGCIYNLNIVSHALKPAQWDQRKSQASSRVSLAHITHTHGPQSVPLHQPAFNPSPFLSSSESRFFMHIFSTETAIRLFPAAPGLFLQRMISAAFETPHLLYALLAAACSHHARLVHDETSRSRITCLRFTNLAISSLRSSLARSEGELNADVVTTAMALCTNDVCNGHMNTWRTHLSGVMRLLISFLDRRQGSSVIDDPYIQCLVKWFTTMNLLAGSSGIAQSGTADAQTTLLRAAGTANTGFVDDICGYSLELVPMLSRITQLVHHGRSYGSGISTPTRGRDEWLGMVAQDIGQLEKEIAPLAGRTASDTLLASGSELAMELEQTNCAFVYSALLHLHCRAQLLPKSHPKVRTDIANVVTAMQQIRPFSPANILILWPVFSAGCETEDPVDRSLIQDRMKNMQSLGMGNFTRARELLTRYWESGSTLPWDIYFEREGIELVLF